MDVALETPVAALLAWTRAHPAYRYVVDATEYASGQVQRSTLDVTYDARMPLEVVRIISGNGHGSVVTWRGGNRVSVRPPGFFHVLSVSMNVRDPRVLSLRRNDVRTAIFSRVADCIAAHAGMVRIERGASATVITVSDPAGVRCGEEDGDLAVTVDRVTVGPDDHPIVRERYAGETLVERWMIRDVRALP
jgi:hypothetical protein